MNAVGEKSKQALSGFYLTLVSIMQSLALGYLLQVLGSKLTSTGTLPANTLLQSAIALIIIILVWHEYAMGTIAYVWKLDIRDSAIPYLIGIAEALIIGSMALDENKKIFGTTPYTLWLWSIVIFVFAGILAHVNQYRKAKIEPEAKTSEQQTFLAVAKSTTWFTVGYFVIFFLLALIRSTCNFPDRYQWTVSLFILMMFVVEVVRVNKNYNEAQKAENPKIPNVGEKL